MFTENLPAVIALGIMIVLLLVAAYISDHRALAKRVREEHAALDARAAAMAAHPAGRGR